MDLQLTNVEHFSESDAADKMRQLNVRAVSSTLQKKKKGAYEHQAWWCTPVISVAQEAEITG
jgi:hypothetical protein